MSLVSVGLGQTENINQSGNDTVAFLGLGTLNIAGTPGAPIDVTLSQVAGIGALDTINMTDANVTLGGLAGVSALVNYTIGAGGRLTLANTAGVAVGSTISFTAPNSALVLGNGVDLSAFTGITGFAPGSTIDVSTMAASVTYADNPGSSTGGTLTLLDSNGAAVATLPLTTGEYAAGEFKLSGDGNGGTQVSLGITADGVTATPATADLGAGRTVVFGVSTSAPVTVTGGVPTLSLNDGGVATYDPAASAGGVLGFTYTVAPGENTPDLAVVGVNLNGATVAGSGGVSADLSGAVVNPAGILHVDTTQPVVTGVTTNPGSGMVQPGQTVAIGVGISEGVGVTGGTPTLGLSDGGTASYDPTSSTPTMLMFMHTVQTGQTTPDLSVTGVALNGSSISDAAGNVLDLSGAIMNPAGTITVADGSTVVTTGGLGVYRFFDGSTGTHFFTADAREKTTLMNTSSVSYRPDLVEEVNNFGAVDASAGGANIATVYRFFDTVHGTHFFTASQSEANGLKDPTSASYRTDLIFEAASSFAEHSSQQAGDVAVYRFFDKTYGTHFYTGSQSEYTGITTAGSATYRSDLVSEGVGFYAPTGSYV